MKNRKIEFALTLLDNKLNEFTTAINYWSNELNKTDNTPLRQRECNNNVNHFKSIYGEIYSIYTTLKLNK